MHKSISLVYSSDNKHHWQNPMYFILQLCLVYCLKVLQIVQTSIYSETTENRLESYFFSSSVYIYRYTAVLFRRKLPIRWLWLFTRLVQGQADFHLSHWLLAPDYFWYWYNYTHLCGFSPTTVTRKSIQSQFKCQEIHHLTPGHPTFNTQCSVHSYTQSLNWVNNYIHQSDL